MRLHSDYSQSQAEIIHVADETAQVVFVLLVTAVGTSLFEAAARFAQAPLQVLGSACLCLPHCKLSKHRHLKRCGIGEFLRSDSLITLKVVGE